MYMYLLDITKQRCCIEWFVSGLYNYIHFPDGVPIISLILKNYFLLDKALLEGFQARITVGSWLWLIT